MSKIITREAAKETGLVFYFSRLACKNGHIADRYTQSGRCQQCHFLAIQKSAAKYRSEKLELSAAKAETKRAQREQTSEVRKAGIKARVQAYNAIWRKTNAVKMKAVNDIWRANNIEKMTATTTAWRKLNPQKIREYTAAWEKRNPEKQSAKSIARYAKDPEASKKRCAEWRNNNPGKTRAYMQNYKAIKESSGEKLSIGLAEKLFLLQGGKCPCCKLPLGDDYHMDHIIPLKRGGPNNDANIQLLRQRCNNQKNAKDPLLFMQSRGFLL